MGINHISLMGTISRGPEYRMTPSGVPTANFTVAVTRPPRGDGGHEVTDFIRVVVWRALAEKVNEAVQKGDLVIVEGRLSTRSYETQDGQRRKVVEVEASVVEPVKVGGGARQASQEPAFDSFDDYDETPAPAPAARRAPAAPAQPPADLDDEIPF